MILVEYKRHDSSRHYGLLGVSLEMWRMDIFIRHNCDKLENIVEHRSSTQSTLITHIV